MGKALLMASFFLALRAGAEEADFGAWAERTLTLRGEVESLAKTVDEGGRAQAAEREQLRQRELELAAQLQKETLRAAQLGEKNDRLKKRLRVEDALPVARKKELLQWSADLSAEVAASLPVRRAERLREIEELNRRIEKGEGYERLVADLWALTEKELRLTRENVFEVMTLQLEDGEKKAEVARAGMVQLAFVTADGRAGFARREKGTWTLREGEGEAEREAARRMVDRFRDQGPRGYFEMPLSAEVL